ncbi:unnamed protein product [Lymnaea stagnalis]|uniref:SUZ RNA-binding domain-containing n=1 Tax=Lymnaea stagnalis TaxID=6523 RepID=A0AAV2IC67_LYMST
MAEEEIDLDSWEEQADSGVLDKRLEEMSIDIQAKENDKRKQAQSIHSTASPLLIDDSGKTQYQPQVRILRREPKTPSSPQKNHRDNSGLTNVTASSKHSKSLQQREAEYAQARLRIFGSLPPEENDENDDGNGTDSFTAKDDDLNIEKQSSPQIIKPDPSSPRVSIVRQPKGPDGTSGFKKSDPT